MYGKIAASIVIATSMFAAKIGEGSELVGTRPPKLALEHWINSAPVEIGALKGKVVLIRWWTDTCPFCAATAPALRLLQEKYGAAGLQVIGVFHPKPAGDWSVERMQRAATRFQFAFPVGLDADWKTLKRWWLDGARREATSVSFIIDRSGVIRYVHPGPEFNPGACVPGYDRCESDFNEIDKTISDLLREK